MNTEYIPDPSENNNHKAFRIAPAEPDITSIILEARRACHRDPDLSDGAKVLFDFLLDLSLLWTVSRTKGAVTISATKISESIHRSIRAIYGWKKELLKKRMIWISKYFMPNTWPIDVMHITAIDAPQTPQQLATQDGMWGNGARRGLQGQPGLGARKPGQLTLSAAVKVENRFKLPYGKKQHPGGEDQKSSILLENATASGTKQHLSVAELATGSSKVCHGEQQETTPPNGKVCHGEQQETAPASSKVCHGQQHKTAHLREHSAGSIEQSKGGKAPPIRVKSVLDCKDQLAGVEKRISAILAHADNYELHLAKDVAEAIEWLKDPKNAKDRTELHKNLADAERRRKNRKNWIKGAMTEAARRDLSDLKARKVELEKALAGGL